MARYTGPKCKICRRKIRKNHIEVRYRRSTLSYDLVASAHFICIKLKAKKIRR